LISNIEGVEAMKCLINNLQILFSALGGYIGWFIGGMDGFLYALVAFVIIDYLTGVMRAILEKRLSSEVGYRGIFKKILIFGLVGIGHTVDLYLVQKGSVFRTAVIFFYLSNEGISILENASRIGLPIPEKLKQVLEGFAVQDKDEVQQSDWKGEEQQSD
jgi:toxin secretion/phage lysis holin